MKIAKEHITAARRNGINYAALYDRIKSGWEIEKAISTPMRGGLMMHGVLLTEEDLDTARKNGLTRDNVRTRLAKGWPLERAISQKNGERRTTKGTQRCRKLAANDTKKVSKERADIAAFASENGLSYGVVVSYLESGLTLKEIQKQYGMKFEKTPHRWAQCFGEVER